MSASKVIKKILVDKNMSVKDLAEMLGIKAQVLSNKLYRNTFTYEEYIRIAHLLGCEVKTVSEDSKIEYINEYKETEEE